MRAERLKAFQVVKENCLFICLIATGESARDMRVQAHQDIEMGENLIIGV